MARPQRAKHEIQDVLSLVAAGDSLRTAAEKCGMSVQSALRGIESAGLAEQYARAREERADVLAEQMIEIADVGSGDAQRDRLRLDARKWFASKLYPRKYGDKIDATLTGEGGGPVKLTVIERVIVDHAKN